jgi:hypothetical protein
MNNLHRSVLLGSVLLVSSPLQADEWKHEFAPYIWGAAMEGQSGIGPVTVDIDMSFSDIVDNLETGFQGMYRATKDQWSVSVDLVYMGLGATGNGPQGYVRGDLDMDQIALEVDGGYEVMERLVVFGGLRYNDVSIELDASGPSESISADKDESWIDPVIGAHYTVPFSDKWSMTLRGDIGGFGVGSDFAWQGVASVRWQPKERLGVLAAYRYFDMDYEDGSGLDRFVYDMSTSGPGLGVVFTF